MPKIGASVAGSSRPKRARRGDSGATKHLAAPVQPSTAQDRTGGLLIYAPFDVIAERLHKLPRQQARFAERLLGQPELVAFGSVRQVASQVGINLATIIRFAQSLGYDGYQSMQAAIRHAYLMYAGLPVPSEPPPLSPGQTSLDPIRARHRSNVDTMFDQLNPREIDAVAELMLHARLVRACGDGASAHAATHLVRLLRYTGIPALTIPAEGIDRPLYLYDASSSDVVVGICLTTTLRGPVEVLERARQLGAHTVAISASKVNALAAAADYSFVAPAQGVTMVFSLVAAIAMVESIAWVVRSKREEASTKIHNTLQDWYSRDGHVAYMTPGGQRPRRRSTEQTAPAATKRGPGKRKRSN